MTGFVRLSGIAAFVAVLAVGTAMGLRIAQIPSDTLDTILALILTASFAVAFSGTKAFFNAHDYRRADLAVYAFVGLCIVMTVVGLIELSGMVLDPGGVATQIVDVTLITVTIALTALFGLLAIGFASAGGRIWKAVGMLYLVGSIALAFVIVSDFTDLAKVSPLLKEITSVNTAVFLLALTASVIVHGIALTAGAGRMRMAVAAA